MSKKKLNIKEAVVFVYLYIYIYSLYVYMLSTDHPKISHIIHTYHSINKILRFIYNPHVIYSISV